MSWDLSRFAGQRILITGASGFIGTHLCRRLVGCGAELHAVSREARTSNGFGLRWWRADLAEFAAVHEIISTIRPEIVFHLASLVTGAREVALVIPTLRSNLLSTVNLLTAVAEQGCGRLILAGSMEEPVTEHGLPVPCSPYAASKSAASSYGRMFHTLFGLPTAMLRIFTVYGPGQMDTSKLIPYVILSLLTGKAPNLTGGHRAVDWIFVDDVIDALIAAAKTENLGMVTLDVGSGTLVTVREIAERLLQLIDPSLVPVFGAIEDRPHEVVRWADIAATEKIIGWRPRTFLGDGLAKTVEWYKRQSQSSPPSASQIRA